MGGLCRLGEDGEGAIEMILQGYVVVGAIEQVGLEDNFYVVDIGAQGAFDVHAIECFVVDIVSMVVT